MTLWTHFRPYINIPADLSHFSIFVKIPFLANFGRFTMSNHLAGTVRAVIKCRAIVSLGVLDVFCTAYGPHMIFRSKFMTLTKSVFSQNFWPKLLTKVRAKCAQVEPPKIEIFGTTENRNFRMGVYFDWKVILWWIPVLRCPPDGTLHVFKLFTTIGLVKKDILHKKFWSFRNFSKLGF